MLLYQRQVERLLLKIHADAFSKNERVIDVAAAEAEAEAVAEAEAEAVAEAVAAWGPASMKRKNQRIQLLNERIHFLLQYVHLNLINLKQRV
jgi:hypothetical protein